MSEPQTLAAALFVGLTSLSGVVVFLWRRIETYHTATVTKLEQCEIDRAKLWEKIAEMECKA